MVPGLAFQRYRSAVGCRQSLPALGRESRSFFLGALKRHSNHTRNRSFLEFHRNSKYDAGSWQRVFPPRDIARKPGPQDMRYPRSYTFTMFGWLRVAAARASRRNLSMKTGSFETGDGGSLPLPCPGHVGGQSLVSYSAFSFPAGNASLAESHHVVPSGPVE